MSRTKKGSKRPGAEYWSKRPTSNHGGSGPSRDTKVRTHRIERLQGKKQIKEQIDEE